MKELIERLEKATGPDRDLDDQIAEAIGCERHLQHWWKVNGVWQLTCPQYTSSIDAAITLMPDIGEREVQLQIRPDHTNAAFYSDTFDGVGVAAPHKTAPIAICIAALMALEALAHSPAMSSGAPKKTTVV